MVLQFETLSIDRLLSVLTGGTNLKWLKRIFEAIILLK